MRRRDYDYAPHVFDESDFDPADIVELFVHSDTRDHVCVLVSVCADKCACAC